MHKHFAIATLTLLPVACALSAVACSSSDPAPAATPDVDSGAPDTGSTSSDTGSDSSDSGSADSKPVDTGSDDTAKVDTGTADTKPEDAGLFPCGTEMCAPKFQYCHVDTAPGACTVAPDAGPDADSGFCTPGCPGCPPPARKCEAIPSDCFAFPSCPCITGKVCAGGTSTCSDDGGITLGCNGL